MRRLQTSCGSEGLGSASKALRRIYQHVKKNEEGEPSVAEETLSKKEVKSEEKVDDLPFDVEDDKPKATKKTDDVAAAFDDLFNN